ncbi:copper resistance protein B [Sulfurovum sp. ST-21]|uniref:Copper resistance protein B n=1 Tax=Sulfurovum indicum TaxID=2779528 RepID=A0A7M1S210_9BACT|nr:copper resistance protein B [Sulfurovum indicum]QOR61112.1 copper resistance protein B [Sulfurovum indicum]
MKQKEMNLKKILLLLGSCMAIGQTLQAAGADDPLRTMLIMDRLEILDNDENTRAWEGSFYIGYDIDKLYIYSEGSATSEGLESSQNELVYSRAIAPFWDIQAGIAYDKNSDASRTWGEIAIAGLAPYFFETRAALLVNSNGNTALRLDAEYEALITQKLILTPSLAVDFYTKDDPSMQTGSGLSAAEAGLRLRYEIVREFAPYIGVTWEKTFGNTRNFNAVDETSLLIGVRFWF